MQKQNRRFGQDNCSEFTNVAERESPGSFYSSYGGGPAPFGPQKAFQKTGSYILRLPEGFRRWPERPRSAFLDFRTPEHRSGCVQWERGGWPRKVCPWAAHFPATPPVKFHFPMHMHVCSLSNTHAHMLSASCTGIHTERRSELSIVVMKGWLGSHFSSLFL